MIVVHWALANTFFYFFGNATVNYIAPVAIAILCTLFILSRMKSLNGAFIYRTFFIYYFMYFLINSWHLAGRVFFPETFVATYWFSLAASNGVFILIVSTLWLLAILKFLDNNAEGGLMGVYERNIDNWRRWFGGR
ncbi:MAG: hypothetical protein AAFW81_06955 [Pseudomonadota bacterium]